MTDNDYDQEFKEVFADLKQTADRYPDNQLAITNKIQNIKNEITSQTN